MYGALYEATLIMQGVSSNPEGLLLPGHQPKLQVAVRTEKERSPEPLPGLQQCICSCKPGSWHNTHSICCGCFQQQGCCCSIKQCCRARQDRGTFTHVAMPQTQCCKVWGVAGQAATFLGNILGNITTLAAKQWGGRKLQTTHNHSHAGCMYMR